MNLNEMAWRASVRREHVNAWGRVSESDRGLGRGGLVYTGHSKRASVAGMEWGVGQRQGLRFQGQGDLRALVGPSNIFSFS